MVGLRLPFRRFDHQKILEGLIHPVDWNYITLVLLAIFSLLGLAVMLVIAFLKQLPELADALRKAIDAFSGPGGPAAQ
ncbi:hypothetical protein [Streptomyces sp. NRRL B-24484]|uniref:hypothetical protein n=1 Tax=Streptomyces sp. NRRL B-24484 TaxID=1463833 RepID=UPI001F3D605F|nr:hypothetical protein [Streptomyces sp. NRRL B-24484]